MKCALRRGSKGAILPRQLPSSENINIAVRYAPIAAVAGDLYTFPAVHPDGLGVLVADVTGHVSLESGDRLLLYSDGLAEAENAVEESFGEVALPTFIEEKQDSETEQFTDLLLKEVLTWSCDGPQRGQTDDITMIVIDIMGRTA